MSAFNDISVALNQRLQAYATANSKQVAWENSGYVPTTGTLFLRPTVLPIDTVQAGLGTSGQEFHDGIFQVDIFAPVDQPKATSLAIADAVADYFARGLVLTYNGVKVRIGTASIGAGNRENSWYQIPVEIDYHSFTQARTSP